MNKIKFHSINVNNAGRIHDLEDKVKEVGTKILMADGNIISIDITSGCDAVIMYEINHMMENDWQKESIPWNEKRSSFKGFSEIPALRFAYLRREVPIYNVRMNYDEWIKFIEYRCNQCNAIERNKIIGYKTYWNWAIIYYTTMVDCLTGIEVTDWAPDSIQDVYDKIRNVK